MYRNVLLSIHIASVAAWLGANLTQFFLAPWFTQRGGEVAAAWFEATTRMARRYYNAAGTVLAVSGVLLLLESSGAYRWSSGFVVVGLAVVTVGAALGIAFFAPDGERLAAAARDGRRVNLGRFLSVLCLDTVLVSAAVLAMVAKWRL